MEKNKFKPLHQFRVILVQPKNPRNIGSVCRAMKTMGITDLAIVTDTEIDSKDAAVSAVHAEEVLLHCRRHASLDEALSDTVYAAGITRRRGKFRKYYSLLPEEFAEKSFSIKKGKIALVFGTEEGGLTDAELQKCHTAVTIPSSPLFPSLNLSHAVQILCYTLFCHAQKNHNARLTPVRDEELSAMIQLIIEYLEPLQFYKRDESERLFLLLHDVLGRSQLAKGESRRILSLFKKITGVYQKKQTKPEK